MKQVLELQGGTYVLMGPLQKDTKSKIIRMKPLQEAMEDYKKKLIIDRLYAFNGSVTRASESLGIQRTYLSRLISKYKLNERENKKIRRRFSSKHAREAYLAGDL